MRRAVRSVLPVAGAILLFLAGPSGAAQAAVAPSVVNPQVEHVTPAQGKVVGVGHPVIVTFREAVANRAAAERSIKVTSPGDMTGTYDWVSDREVQWKPDRFWPAHSEIKLTAGGTPLSFRTGSAVVGVADISAHTFTVSIDEQVVREMPASMGKPRFSTPVGSFTVLEKQSPVIMDSRTIGIPLSDPEGYKLTVQNAVRITWGGVYVHSAPWSVGSQGKANVSHGCINLSPDNASWYYKNVEVGDPVIVQA